MSQSGIVLHGVELSGHTHRVQLMLRMLELPFSFSEAGADVRSSETFRKLNPMGQIPVLEDGNIVLPDSNAIMVYLVKRYAPGSHWLPDDAVAAANVQRWLSISAGEIRFGPGLARVMKVFGAGGDIDTCHALAARVLTMMESHLADRIWLATGDATIADLACYSYVAHAPEGGISLEPYPAVRAWLKRVEALPHFKVLPAAPRAA
ncbi:glutathione S-transferase [Mesorhizobium sp. NBSH29]|uniref:glutathione S-transferase n=1 Tax=Mesorhizobium sp. NBSH29 TaxID=2654249 RepID=UPI0018964DE7|nr:glutathione S-transferase [Mesorhizobium sp. NBSH29]QPC88033.1 glutathione S-transferase [Mesorhizobium sp. NBSH29]